MMDITVPISTPILGPLPTNQPLNGTFSLAENLEEQAIDWSPTFFQDAFLDEPCPSFELASDPVQEVAQEKPTSGASSPPGPTNRRKSMLELDNLEQNCINIPQESEIPSCRVTSKNPKKEEPAHHSHSRHKVSSSSSAYHPKHHRVRDLSAVLPVSGANSSKSL
jgi:hypothetical protein